MFNVLDLGTRCKYSEPTNSKDTLDTFTVLNKIKGDKKLHHVYSDGFGSIRQACKLLLANHELSTPGVHHSNALIERCNQDILYGTRVLLVQAGLPACFWPYASPCYCHLENITEDDDGDSPWYRRHGSHFKGLKIPFGCGVFFLPVSTKYVNAKAAPPMSYGIFMGYRLAPGGQWNGEYIVADLDDFVGGNFDVDAPGVDYRI